MESVLVTTTAGVFSVDLEDGKNCHHAFQDSDGAREISRVSRSSNVFAGTGGSRALVSFWKFSEKSANPFYKVSTPEKLSSMAFSKDGNFFFAGGLTGSMFVWQTFTGFLLKQWTAHFSEISKIILNPEETMLITASKDGSIKIFSLAQIFSEAAPSALTTLSGHSLPVTKISLAQNYLVSIAEDSYLKVWSFPGGAELKSAPLHSLPTAVVADALAGIFLGFENGQVACTNWENLEISTLDAHAGPVCAVVLSMDGSRLVSASVDGVRFWDARKMQTLRMITLASLDKSVPVGLEIFARPGNEKFPQLKPLQRVLTEIEKIEKIQKIGGNFKNIFGKEEEEWLLSEKFFSEISDAQGCAVVNAAAEIEKQRRLTLEWIEVFQKSSKQPMLEISNLPERPRPAA